MITRRKFIQAGATILSASIIPLHSISSTLPEIIFGGAMRKNQDGSVHYLLSLVNITDTHQDFIQTKFLPHGLQLHPNTRTLIAFEKKGYGACEIDIKTNKVVRDIPPINNRKFYGHGTYSADGKTIYSTEVLPNLTGVIGIRDSETLKDLGTFPSFGSEPHECKLINNGKTLAVTNAGNKSLGIKPNIAFIDVNTKKLVEQFNLTREDINAGHLYLSSKGDMIVGSAPAGGDKLLEKGGVSIKPQGLKLETLRQPIEVVGNMIGEALSVVIANKSNIAAVTHPQGNMVTFWNISERSLITKIELENPRGIALSTNEESFYISYGKKGDLMRLKNRDLTSSPKAQIIQNSFFSGSHIYNLNDMNKELLSHLPSES